MDDVHEVVEYIKEQHPTATHYDNEEFTDIFEQFFEQYTSFAFEKLAHQTNKTVDLYEVISLITLINRDDYERKLDFLFRLFDTDQSDNLEITEFILTAQATIQGLTKIVGIDPPTFNDVEMFVQQGFFREADENDDNAVSLEEFQNLISNNWQFSDWLHQYANVQTFQHAEKSCQNAYFFYLKLYQQINEGKLIKSDSLIELIHKEKPNIKQETLKLLIETLEGTTQFLNKQAEPGLVGENAYRQVMKAWSAFDGCDLDGNNSIDNDQLKYLIYAYEGENPTQERIYHELKQVDSDQSGYINRQEWLRYLCTDPQSSGVMQFRANLKELFKEHDKDNSGSLNREELIQVIKENLKELTNQYQCRGGWDLENYLGMIGGVVDDIMDGMDQNSDGRCTWVEFKHFMELALKQQDKLQEFIKSFEK